VAGEAAQRALAERGSGRAGSARRRDLRARRWRQAAGLAPGQGPGGGLIAVVAFGWFFLTTWLQRRAVIKSPRAVGDPRHRLADSGQARLFRHSQRRRDRLHMPWRAR